MFLRSWASVVASETRANEIATSIRSSEDASFKCRQKAIGAYEIRVCRLLQRSCFRNWLAAIEMERRQEISLERIAHLEHLCAHASSTHGVLVERVTAARAR